DEVPDLRGERPDRLKVPCAVRWPVIQVMVEEGRRSRERAELRADLELTPSLDVQRPAGQDLADRATREADRDLPRVLGRPALQQEAAEEPGDLDRPVVPGQREQPVRAVISGVEQLAAPGMRDIRAPALLPAAGLRLCLRVRV